MRAPGTQLREDTAASGKLEKSTELGRMALWKKKPLHLWGYTSWLRSPLPNFPTLFKIFKTKTEKRKKNKEKKSTHLMGKKGVLHTPEDCRGSTSHCTRSVKFSGKTPRHFSNSLCWFQSLSFTPMSQPSSWDQQSMDNTGPPGDTLSILRPKLTREEPACLLF